VQVRARTAGVAGRRAGRGFTGPLKLAPGSVGCALGATQDEDARVSIDVLSTRLEVALASSAVVGSCRERTARRVRRSVGVRARAGRGLDVARARGRARACAV